MSKLSSPASSPSASPSGARPARRAVRPSRAARAAPRGASAAIVLAALGLAACSGGGGGGFSASTKLALVEAGHGFDVLLPHRAQTAGGEPVALASLDELLAHVAAGAQVLAPAPWPAEAKLPDGSPGNHYLYARLSQPIDVASVFSPSGGLAGGVLALSAAGAAAQPLDARIFVGGFTVGPQGLERWVAPEGDGVVALADLDGDGAADASAPPGLGFPGTEGALPGSALLASPSVIVVVADTDGDLSTHETFPPGAAIQLRLSESLRGLFGDTLEAPALASATVGPDAIAPEVLGAGGAPAILPGGGDVDVDPSTPVTVAFTEPVQPASVGSAPGAPPALAPSVSIAFGPTTAPAAMPYHAVPASAFDLSRYALVPAYPFPGTGPEGEACGVFAQVTVDVLAGALRDLAGNANQQGAQTWFVAGSGAGVVNAPIVPEAIVVGRGGAEPSLGVVDLNGFGFGTGAPRVDPTCAYVEGRSNAGNDPNLALGVALIPPLVPGACTFDGGSSGPFTLTRDSSLDDRLARGAVASISDLAIGRSLDALFHDGAPFGCQAGGDNPCAATGLKQATFSVSSTSSYTIQGFDNLVQFAPHPNPPPLAYPPTCVAPLIGGREPTSVDVLNLTGASNLLGPGLIPFGHPASCTPPDGLFSPTAHVFTTWGGPRLGATPGVPCPIFTVRQQVGHFLYVADRAAGAVVVLSSNRMTVLDSIPVPDPTSFAMSPALDLLAVTSEGADSVSFVDVDPGSPTFHTVIRTVSVGNGPTGVAWQPENEDVLVCNTKGSSLSVISAATLTVRKTIANQLSGPIDVAVTPRQLGFGLSRYVYYAYVLNQDGKVSVFESGPDGVNGWGYDSIIGVLSFTFREPRAIQPDPLSFNSGFWVAHQDQLGPDGQPTGLKGGAVTNVVVTGGTSGVLPLDLAFGDPQIRDLQWGVRASIGSDQLTGVPTDLAFDDFTNQTVYPNFATPFSHGSPLGVNGKGLVHVPPGSAPTLGNRPVTLLVAVPTSSEGDGAIDVLDIASGNVRIDVNPFQPGKQSIPASGARVLAGYFRQ